MNMKEYKQQDIDHILKVADASKYDEEELQQMLNIVIINTLELSAPTNLKIDYEDYETITEYSTRIIETAQAMSEQLGIETNQKVNNYFRISSYILSLNEKQGIIVGDYDRNIWRIAYTLKTIYSAEIEKKYNIPITDESDLLENIEDSNINHFTTSYNRITKNYIEAETNRIFLRFISEYLQIDNFNPLINKFKLETNLLAIVQNEADRLRELLLEQAQGEDRDTNDFITLATGKYDPLFAVPDLTSIKLSEAEYKEIRDRYLDLPLNNFLIKLNLIKNHFYDAIRGYYLDD